MMMRSLTLIELKMTRVTWEAYKSWVARPQLQNLIGMICLHYPIVLWTKIGSREPWCGGVQ